jgi:RHS repeat-associated protein
VGNRLVMIDSGQRTSSTYNIGNQMTVVARPNGQRTTISWDLRGNCLVENTAGALNTYTWDDQNRMTVAAVAGAGVETYTYAADGMRRRKVTASGTTNYVWDGENVLAELDGSLVTQAQYTQYPGEWGGLASQRRSGVSSFYSFDLQGSTRALVSAAAAITDSYSFKAFGVELAVSGSTVNPYRYIGELGYHCDSSTRYYVRTRHLDAGSGRWMSRDPLGLGAGDLNAYRYVANNPLALADPAGMAAATLAPPTVSPSPAATARGGLIGVVVNLTAWQGQRIYNKFGWPWRKTPPKIKRDKRQPNREKVCEDAFNDSGIKADVAFYDPINPKNSRIRFGAVICYQGNRYACVFGVRAGDANLQWEPKQCDWLNWCTYQHELAHFEDPKVICEKGNMDFHLADLNVPTNWGNNIECALHKKTLECFQGSHPAPRCELQTQDMIRSEESWLDDHCPNWRTIDSRIIITR